MTHVSVVHSPTRIGYGAGRRHVRQKPLVATALLAVAGVVADIVIVACLGEVDVAVRADLVGDDVLAEALLRTAAIERRNVAGVRYAVGTLTEIGNRIAGLDAGRLAALGRWIEEDTVAHGRSRHGRPGHPNAG